MIILEYFCNRFMATPSAFALKFEILALNMLISRKCSFARKWLETFGTKLFMLV